MRSTDNNDGTAARPLWQKGLMLLLLVSLVLMFSALGVWQLQRLTWKQELMATVDARIHAEPVEISAPSDWHALNVEELVYQPVRLEGVFDHANEVQSLAATEYGSGYWVMTPLRLNGGGTVLINRGFVPQAMRDPAARPASPPTDKVVVIGLLRASEPQGGFLRDNDPDAGRWYSRDTVAIAQARQLVGPVAPFFVDAGRRKESDTGVVALSELTDGVPRDGLTVVSFRNSHLTYALTWFALAMLSVVGVVLLLKDRREEGLSE